MTQTKPDELLALYCFYAKEAIRQNTQNIWSTTGFTARGLHWKEEKVRRVKKRLIELKLVEDVPQKKTENGKWEKAYLRIRYLMSPDPTIWGSAAGGESQNGGGNCYGKKDAVERKNSKREYHPTGTPSERWIKKVETNNQARIINLYHDILCHQYPEFLPITELTDQLRNVLEVYSETEDSDLKEIFRTAFRHEHRTLVRILWAAYERQESAEF